MEHLDKVETGKITFLFDIVPAYSVLQLIAQASDLEARNQGAGFVIGNASHAADIDKLREAAAAFREKHDDTQLRNTGKIIALAKPEPGEFEPYVDDAYDELADIATLAKDYARAESLHRSKLAHVERLEGTKDGVECVGAERHRPRSLGSTRCGERKGHVDPHTDDYRIAGGQGRRVERTSADQPCWLSLESGKIEESEDCITHA